MIRFVRSPDRPARRAAALHLLLLLAVCCGPQAAGPAFALVHLDFEQAYYVHPGRQVWDFSLVRQDSLYHIFYHSILESTSHASYADTIWRADSPDLRRWSDPVPVLLSGATYADTAAIWAPDVFWDEDNGMWMMAYTGCDLRINQRTLLAESSDLRTWRAVPQNPVLTPDPETYIWDADKWWSDFRDPYVFRQDNQWHMLVTAKQHLSVNTGILYHAVADEIYGWQDAGYFFANDAEDPRLVLESPQYFVRGDWHHLMVGQYDDQEGVSLMSAASPDGWTMTERVMIEAGGYAPEVEQFDPGHDIYGRITPYYPDPSDTERIGYVARFDTLLTDPDGGNPEIYKPHPLARDWEDWSGIANLANPTFGDNPAARGDESCGLVGNGFYGSQEYYMGPLSNRGSPGLKLGDAATGTLTSRPFVIEGEIMELLVGGGHYPETCYVALVSAADSTIWCSETGDGGELMTRRTWNLVPYIGQEARIRIVDDETGAMGHINVDEIREIDIPGSPAADTPPAGGAVLRHTASPNPFNPLTRIRFTLGDAGAVRVTVHDLRGRLVWRSAARAMEAGDGSVSWNGRTRAGESAAAGSYVYRILVDGAPSASGKLTLLK